jgi:hypothetical protein
MHLPLSYHAYTFSELKYFPKYAIMRPDVIRRAVTWSKQKLTDEFTRTCRAAFSTLFTRYLNCQVRVSSYTACSKDFSQSIAASIEYMFMGLSKITFHCSFTPYAMVIRCRIAVYEKIFCSRFRFAIFSFCRLLS